VKAGGLGPGLDLCSPTAFSLHPVLERPIREPRACEGDTKESTIWTAVVSLSDLSLAPSQAHAFRHRHSAPSGNERRQVSTNPNQAHLQGLLSRLFQCQAWDFPDFQEDFLEGQYMEDYRDLV